MAYIETSIDFSISMLKPCRIKYAAHLYDELLREFPPTTAAIKACELAKIDCETLRLYLPEHRRKERILRNHKIVSMRASGYSINLIAATLAIHRVTVNRVLAEFKSRLNAATRYDKHKIRGRLKLDDPRLEEDSICF